MVVYGFEFNAQKLIASKDLSGAVSYVGIIEDVDRGIKEIIFVGDRNPNEPKHQHHIRLGLFSRLYNNSLWRVNQAKREILLYGDNSINERFYKDPFSPSSILVYNEENLGLEKLGILWHIVPYAPDNLDNIVLHLTREINSDAKFPKGFIPVESLPDTIRKYLA